MQFFKALTLGLLVSTLAATSAQAGSLYGKFSDFRDVQSYVHQLLSEIKSRHGLNERGNRNRGNRDWNPNRGNRDWSNNRGRHNWQRGDFGKLPRCGLDKPPNNAVPELDGGSAGIALGLLLSLVAMRRERNIRKQG